MDTLNFTFRILQLRPRNPTNTLRPTISVTTLNTPQAAQILVSPPFPLGDQRGIPDTLLQTPLVKFATDGSSFIEKVVNVTGSLMVDLEDWPGTFDYSFALVTGVFSCTQK